jgi:hypothetical protein
LPPAGIALGVHARDNNDRVTVQAVEKGIGEALWDESAAGVAVQDGVGVWVLEQSISRRSECREELVAQTGLLRLVPFVSILDVGGCGRPDDDPLHRPRL